MAAVPYIGSKISLISKSDLRYEGTLFTIDPANSTVSLSNVVCFGTEERLPEVTPGSDTVYPFLIFKGADIKNLYVIEDIDTTQSHPSPPSDPAILNASAPTQSPNAAVIAAANAKSEAEKADKLLVQQMSKASISASQQPSYSHPAGFPPRPVMPTGQYGYGYQPQGIFYAPAGASPYNPVYPGMYTSPMPYPSMRHPTNAAPVDVRQPPSNVPQGDFRQLPSIAKFTPPPLFQAQSLLQNQQAKSVTQNPPNAAEKKLALQQAPPQAGLPSSKLPISSSSDAYTGPGTAKYLESRRFKPATVKIAESSVTVDEANADTEFDFQSSNARFDKESFIRNLTSPRDAQEAADADAVESRNPSPKSAQPVTKKYDKAASFFDDISLDRDERGRRQNRRGQNEETFGTIAAGYTASSYRRNRNRRGRSNNVSQRYETSDRPHASPQSPIKRTDQNSPKSRGSPRTGGKGKPRRGGRRGGSTPDSGFGQTSRPRSAKRSTRQPVGDNATSV